MNVWSVINNHRRCITALRNNSTEDIAGGILQRAAVVAIPSETIEVLDNLTDGLPEDTIEWPSAEAMRWPWPDQPVMLVPPEAYDCRFVLFNINGEPLLHPKIETSPVIGTLIIPPSLARHETPRIRMPDGTVATIDVNDPRVKEVYANTSKVIDTHPPTDEDRGDSTTCGAMFWNQEVDTPEPGVGFSQQMLRMHCLVQALAMHKLIIVPVNMTRPQQRRLGTELLVVRPLRLGDKRQSEQPAVLRHREHYTAGGLVKKRFASREEAAVVVAQSDPSMNIYECRFCGGIHIGHSTLSRAC